MSEYLKQDRKDFDEGKIAAIGHLLIRDADTKEVLVSIRDQKTSTELLVPSGSKAQ